jgi:hypothetical protein
MSKVSTGNLDWSRITSQPALSSLSGNLDWNRIVSQPALSGLSGNLDWGRINKGTFYLPAVRWIYCTNGHERFYFASNSTTYLRGFGTRPIEFRDGVGTPIAWFDINGKLTCMFETRTATDTDHVVIYGNTELFANNRYELRIAYNTFTGFHRCYTDDELNNENEVDIFKNNYIGRIVISTGNIKTDSTREIKNETIGDEAETKTEWYSAIDKDGIMIEDALLLLDFQE